MTRAALALRARRPEVFGTSASYEPLAAVGPAADHCLAFARSGEVVTAVTRLRCASRSRAAGATPVCRCRGGGGPMSGSLRRELEREVRAAELFAASPVVLLERLPE
ncbi:(1-_4)-alpha-D-glucan 1-alpha-D-glucosylmutase OS=Streptomyces albaduncus OX=68172 GN=FHS32_001361 PE=4 SV=1 [Streptomyces griseoloalbus]